MASDTALDATKSARREAYKRVGRDVLLLGLTYVGRAQRARLAWMLSPTTIALAGAAALATAAYPSASRWIRGRGVREACGVGAVQGSALSPLLANIMLHEFDRQMMRADFHLVRYADDWVVTTQDAETADRALQVAARVLADLRLRINPAKTRILRFETGLEFVGYRFDPFLLTATPPPTSTQPQIRVALNSAVSALRDKSAPAISQFGQHAIQLGREGVTRAADFIRRQRRS